MFTCKGVVLTAVTDNQPLVCLLSHCFFVCLCVCPLMDQHFNTFNFIYLSAQEVKRILYVLVIGNWKNSMNKKLYVGTLRSALVAVQLFVSDSRTRYLTLDIRTKTHLSNYHPQKLFVEIQLEPLMRERICDWFYCDCRVTLTNSTFSPSLETLITQV